MEPTSPSGSPTFPLVPGYDPGIVYCGPTVNKVDLTIPEPQTTFASGKHPFCAFYVQEPFGTRKLGIQLTRQHGGSSVIVHSEDADVDPGWHTVYEKVTTSLEPGDYTITFFIGDTQIAEGSFSVV